MNKLLTISLFIVFQVTNSWGSSGDIVGGFELKYSDPTASSIVYISTENAQNQNEICTGTFISRNLILTAAHCIARDINGMSVSFRQSDFAETQNLIDIEITEAYRLDFSDLRNFADSRNDLGIIQFKGGLPEGATTAALPRHRATHHMASLALSFSAIGFGRNTGLKNLDPLAPTGEGVLRIKTLISTPFQPMDKIFKVDQFENKGGVCFGDSGGPALIIDPISKKNVIIGVASAVLTARKNTNINPEDDCQNEAMYLNMYYFSKHLKKYLKRAIDKKLIDSRQLLLNQTH